MTDTMQIIGDAIYFGGLKVASIVSMNATARDRFEEYLESLTDEEAEDERGAGYADGSEAGYKEGRLEAWGSLEADYDALNNALDDDSASNDELRDLAVDMVASLAQLKGEVES